MGTAKKDIRQEVKKYIDTANDKTVIMIHAMLEAEQQADAVAEKSFEEVVDKRFSDYEKGKAKVISLDELEAGAKTFYRKNQRIAK